MSCNYLFKLPNDEKFTHFIVQGCEGGKAAQAAVKFWLSRHPGTKPSNFIETLETLSYEPIVESKHIYGVSIVSETFEISLIKKAPIKHPESFLTILAEKNLEPNNMPTEITAIIAKSISSSLELLPMFKDLI